MRRIVQAAWQPVMIVSIIAALRVAEALGNEVGDYAEYLYYAVVCIAFAIMFASLWAFERGEPTEARRKQMRVVFIATNLAVLTPPIAICLAVGRPDLLLRSFNDRWPILAVIALLYFGHSYLFEFAPERRIAKPPDERPDV